MKPVEHYYSVRVLSYNPLITVSSCQTDAVFVAYLAEDLPEVFAGKKGLHILLPTWHLEGGEAWRMKKSLDRALERMPEHKFLVVSSSEYETFLLGQMGAPGVFAHQGIFLDEQVWTLATERAKNLPLFDAVYNARLDKIKRHELARAIDKLLLIYPGSLHEQSDASVARLKARLPRAYFANHYLNGGSYASLSSTRIVQLYGNARIGLCLSPEEGYSRASIEYMMCGLPVVSTDSIGGRDRYYSNKYCRVVAGDADAVARAVDELINCNYPGEEVRANLLRLLEFDRGNFLRAINRIIEDHSGQRNLLNSIKPFIGILQKFLPHTELLSRMKDDFANQKVEACTTV